MLAVAGRENVGWLDVESIDKLPCEDLSIIDLLWGKYSDGRFGFSVPKRIYQSLGGTRSYDEKIWQAFGDSVGWRSGREWYQKAVRMKQGSPSSMKMFFSSYSLFHLSRTLFQYR